MKKLTTPLLLLAGLLVLGSLGNAQTMLVMTTLSAAATSASASVVSVASATGISAPTPNSGAIAAIATSEAQSYVYVDRELMEVRGVSGTTLQVIRGVGSTAAAPHASSALVFVVPSAFLLGGSARYGGLPQGSCTRSNELYLPHIQFVSGIVSDCLGGQWVNGDAYQTQRLGPNGLRFPDPGATALTALETAGTAPGAATEEYCTEIDLPQSEVVTGLGVLNGTTVGTDNHLVVLRDAGGKVLATSAVAGAVAANASTYQKYNFINKYFAVAPGRYFGCVQTNGTTATFRHAITAVNDNILAGKLTGQTFGTVIDATMPTTFTTALGPYFLVY